MINKILWSKWRPKTFEDAVILPRIAATIKENGLSTHYLFIGAPGCGKTTLARILTKGQAVLEKNCSLYGSVELLRNDIEEFCSKMSMFDSKDGIKIVYLEEFDGVSKQFQEALRAFMEQPQYEKNVRFVLTANNIGKITDAMKSRFRVISFNPKDSEEEKFLKNGILKRIKDVILPAEGITMEIDDLKKIVLKNFPDFRSTLDDIQYFKETGELNNVVGNENATLKNELYSLVLDKHMNNDKTYHFLMDKFGVDGIENVIRLLGRPFLEWIILNKRQEYLYIFDSSMKVVTDYGNMLSNCADPIVLGMTVVNEIKKLVK
jgi:DNA polymerase III delta prime subunit